MSKNSLWKWNLTAAILLLLAAIINGVQAHIQGSSAINVIPGIAFFVSGILFFIQALRQRGKG